MQTLSAATGAGSYQPVYLQLALVHGRAGAGEHAEALQPGHLHTHSPRCQWRQQRGRLCQVNQSCLSQHTKSFKIERQTALLMHSCHTLMCKFRNRMESTEKCEAIIQHFNGKYIKTPPGVAGTQHFQLSLLIEQTCLALHFSLLMFGCPFPSSYGTSAVQVCRRGAEETSESGQISSKWPPVDERRRDGEK